MGRFDRPRPPDREISRKEKLREALAVLLAAALVAACTSDAERSAIHTERAYEYLAEERPGEAIVELRSALSFAPDDLSAYWRLGGAYLEQGMVRDALFYFEDAHQLDPENDEAALFLADLLVDTDPERAEAILDDVIARSPDLPRAYVIRAEQRLLRSETAGALADAKRATELAPEDPAGYWKQTRIYDLMFEARERKGMAPRPGNIRRALQIYERILQLTDEGRGEALLGRARMIVHLEVPASEVAAAFRAALDAVEAEGNRFAIHQAASETARYAQRFEDRALHERALEQIVVSNPYDMDAWVALGTLRHERGESAHEIFTKLLERNTRRVDTHLAYTRFLERTGGLDAAIAYLEEQIRNDVDPPQLIAAIANRQAEAGRFEEMRATVARARETYPDHWRTQALTADEVLVDGDLVEASKILRDLARTHQDASLYERLALVEFQRKQYESALASIQEAIRRSPGLAIDAKRFQARIQHDLGDCGGAIMTLSALARYNQLQPEDEVILARCRYRTGNSAAGRTLLERVLSRPDPPSEAAIEFARRHSLQLELRPRVYEVLEAAYQREPYNREILFQIASLEIVEKKCVEAIRRLNPALRRDPSAVHLRMLRARCLGALGEFSAASREAQLALAGDLDLQSGAVQLLVTLAYASGRLEESIADVEAAVEQERVPNGGFVLLGQLYLANQQYDEAKGALSKAHDARPDLAVVKNDLAYLLAREGKDLDRALDLARQAVGDIGENSSVAHTLGYVYLKKGRNAAALRQFRHAASLAQSPSSELQYHTGLALGRLGHTDQAVAAFDLAFQIDPVFMQSDEVKHQISALGIGFAPKPAPAPAPSESAPATP